MLFMSAGTDMTDRRPDACQLIQLLRSTCQVGATIDRRIQLDTLPNSIQAYLLPKANQFDWLFGKELEQQAISICL